MGTENKVSLLLAQCGASMLPGLSLSGNSSWGAGSMLSCGSGGCLQQQEKSLPFLCMSTCSPGAVSSLSSAPGALAVLEPRGLLWMSCRLLTHMGVMARSCSSDILLVLFPTVTTILFLAFFFFFQCRMDQKKWRAELCCLPSPKHWERVWVVCPPSLLTSLQVLWLLVHSTPTSCCHKPCCLPVGGCFGAERSWQHCGGRGEAAGCLWCGLLVVSSLPAASVLQQRLLREGICFC